MSETELSVICKNCGSEVSPYVTECPYCGTRLRKRAPKLERRGDGLEAKQPRKRRRRVSRPGRPGFDVSTDFPYATAAIILSSAILLLIQKATGYGVLSFGGLVIPIEDDWWRYLSAPFAYIDVGFLFVVALGRRLGTLPTLVLLIACGSLGMVAAGLAAEAQNEILIAAGGNGMALGALAAWLVIRRAETRGEIGDDYDWIGVAVAAIALILLPLFVYTADWVAGLAGGAIGAICGLFATAFRRTE
jgi:hypothetical protein